MALSENDIKASIAKAIADAKIEVRDLSGDGRHYAVEVSSKSFVGLSRLKQHKMVYDSLKENMKTQLHALTLITKT